MIKKKPKIMKWKRTKDNILAFLKEEMTSLTRTLEEKATQSQML